MKQDVHLEYQKAYVRDEQVQALRRAGVTNFSKFVRNCITGYLEAIEKNKNENIQLQKE
jgi:L-rhamnose mutarotase